MKPRILAAALCLVAINLFGQSEKTSSKNKAETADHAQHTAASIGNERAEANAGASKPSAPPLYTSPEWWLVIIAAGTGLAIAWQARETAKATRAVERNTKAFIESQRPIIAADAKGHPLKDLSDTVPRVRIALSNRGQTTAYHCLHESWIELVPHKIDDSFTFSDAADHFASVNPFSLYPNHEGMVINIPIRNGLTDAERGAIQTAKLLVCIRLRVTFRDAFSPSRYAEFGFWVMYEGMSFLARYNDSN
jgi:hypothetical protein